MLFAAVRFCSGAAEAQNIVLPIIDKGAQPYDTVSNGEVYGTIQYTVSLNNRRDGINSLQDFARTVLKRLSGSSEGNYVITLTVKNGSQEVAKKAVFSFTWKSSSFFFIKTKEEITSNISTSGRLSDHFPITSDNNNLQVGLKLEKTDKISIDTDTYNSFSDQVSLLTFESLQRAVKVAPNVEVPLKIMAKLLDSSTSYTLSSDTAMAFIKDETHNPNKISYRLTGPNAQNSGLVVTVKFNTQASLLAPVVEKKFVNVDISNVIQLARVGVSGASIPFEDSLDKVADKALVEDLASLDKGTFPTGKQPAIVCQQLWGATQRFFSNRDAPLVYAAYLSKYDWVLNVANAKSECLDKYALAFTRLNIPVDKISITK